MSRIINLDSAGKNRTYLIKSVVIALRALAEQREANQLTLDLAAYIALALEGIAETIDSSVLAWEKRGYWLKADRFRMDWNWTATLGHTMRSATLQQDYGLMATTSAQIAEKLKSVKVPRYHRMGKPWEGAWSQLKNSGFSGTKNFSSELVSDNLKSERK